MKHRENAARASMDSFDGDNVLTVHWDGKLLPQLSGKEKEDRLPVIVTDKKLEKILSIPRLPSGSGEHQAQAVFEALEAAGLEDKVAAISFDTTASNTGRANGSCVLLEQKVGRQLIHLACRHHVLELVIGKAFDHLMGPSSGPEITLFKKFKEQWSSVDQTQFKPLLEIGDSVDDVPFILDRLKEDQPRDDYRELLELWLIVLGEKPPRGIKFRAPGAMHRARWMAKVLYALKIILFKDQVRNISLNDNACHVIFALNYNY